MFKFKIYRNHEKQEVTEDGELICTPISTDWFKFDLMIDTGYIVITSLEEYILFDNDGNPTPCTKVYLSDGSIVFAVLKLGTFYDNYVEYRNSLAPGIDPP